MTNMTNKIFRSILLVAVAVLLLSFAIIMNVLYGFFAETQYRQLQSELAIAAHGVEYGGGEWLESLTVSGYRLTRVDADGNVLFDSQADPASMENHGGRQEILQALETGSGRSERMSATLTEKTLYQATRLSDGTVLRISVTQNSILTLTLGMLTPACFVLAAAVALSAVLAGRLSKRIVKPLNNLDLERPLENEVYGELSPLLTRIAQQRREIDRQVAALRQKQDEFAAVTGSMNEGLVLLNEKGGVLSMNPAALALFRVDGDCVGADFLSLERSRGILHAVEQALAGSQGEALLERDGRRYQIDASPIQSGGKTVGAALLSFDITDRAMAEQRRREFTANVSHELKTPLQSILGSAELMETGLVKAEDVPMFTGRIHSEAARLVTLIDDIIRLSQLDEGEDLPVEPVDMLAVAKEAASQLADAAGAKGVQLSVQGKSVSVQGVRRLLHEIAYNLMDNAIRYNREGGSVTATVSAEAAAMVFTVTDTGIGIPGEHLQRIFERFYRVDKSHSKSTGGTGLGLSIVKHAVEAHRGEVTVKSEVGKGTEMRVLIPLARG